MTDTTSNTDDIYLSVIIPSYNEAKSLPTTVASITTAFRKDTLLSKKSIELLLVDDGSIDDTSHIVSSLIANRKASDPAIRYLTLARNFGKEPAVQAGFSRARGALVACIDADGQHPPKDLIKMIHLLENNPDVHSVIGVRADQSHKKIGFVSSIFYAINRSLGSKHLIANGTDFRVMRRGIIEEFAKFSEHDRINRELFDWIGLRSIQYEFQAAERTAGQASYSLRKLTKLAINGLINAGTKPLLAMLPFGMLVTFMSLTALVLAIIDSLTYNSIHLNISLQGYVMIIMILFFGIVFSLLGIIALYIGRIFTEVQNRPDFIVDSRNSIDG